MHPSPIAEPCKGRWSQAEGQEGDHTDAKRSRTGHLNCTEKCRKEEAQKVHPTKMGQTNREEMDPQDMKAQTANPKNPAEELHTTYSSKEAETRANLAPGGNKEIPGKDPEESRALSLGTQPSQSASHMATNPSHTAEGGTQERRTKKADDTAASKGQQGLPQGTWCQQSQAQQNVGACTHNTRMTAEAPGDGSTSITAEQ